MDFGPRAVPLCLLAPVLRVPLVLACVGGSMLGSGGSAELSGAIGDGGGIVGGDMGIVVGAEGGAKSRMGTALAGESSGAASAESTGMGLGEAFAMGMETSSFKGTMLSTLTTMSILEGISAEE